MTPHSGARWPGVADELKRYPKPDRADYPLGNSGSINRVEAVARAVILTLTRGEPGRKYSPDQSRGLGLGIEGFSDWGGLAVGGNGESWLN
ncbi:MAG: hypothetical protein ACRC8Y_14475 [Chroococcales cyanobacterium]